MSSIQRLVPLQAASLQFLILRAHSVATMSCAFDTFLMKGDSHCDLIMEKISDDIRYEGALMTVCRSTSVSQIEIDTFPQTSTGHAWVRRQRLGVKTH